MLQRQIEDEQRLADQREFARLAELQGLAKKREREEKEEAERRKAEQEKVELENRLAQEELKKFERDKREKELLRLSEEAFRIEQEALQAEAEALRAGAIPDEPKPITLHSPEHPLSRVFGVEPASGPVGPAAQFARESTPAPELRKVTPEEMQHVAWLFLNVAGIRVQPLNAQNLLLRFEPSAIEQSIRYMHYKVTSLGSKLNRDQFVHEVEDKLWKSSIERA